MFVFERCAVTDTNRRSTMRTHSRVFDTERHSWFSPSLGVEVNLIFGATPFVAWVAKCGYFDNRIPTRFPFCDFGKKFRICDFVFAFYASSVSLFLCFSVSVSVSCFFSVGLPVFRSGRFRQPLQSGVLSEHNFFSPSVCGHGAAVTQRRGLTTRPPEPGCGRSGRRPPRSWCFCTSDSPGLLSLPKFLGPKLRRERQQLRRLHIHLFEFIE